MERAIAALPDAARAAFLLHDVEGFDHREVGSILGIAEGTSKSQVHKARHADPQLPAPDPDGDRRPRHERTMTMTCHDAESLLHDALDAPLPPADAAALAAHLETCAACRDLEADLALLRDATPRARSADRAGARRGRALSRSSNAKA